MQSELSVSPPNSVLLVVTSDQPKIPHSMAGELVASTPTSVAVGTLNEIDGETTIRLTDESPAAENDGLELIFEERLENPEGLVRVTSVNGELYLDRADTRDPIGVRIWVNNPMEPDLVVVEVG